MTIVGYHTEPDARLVIEKHTYDANGQLLITERMTIPADLIVPVSEKMFEATIKVSAGEGYQRFAVNN